MSQGMNDNILKIDLDSEKIYEETLDKEITAKFLGGRGLGVKLLTDYLPKNIDPLSKKTPLIFSIGPLEGDY